MDPPLLPPAAPPVRAVAEPRGPAAASPPMPLLHLWPLGHCACPYLGESIG